MGHKFDSFTEWWILVKITTSLSVDFYYFYALKYVSDKSFSFWGQTQVSEPLRNKEGNYIRPNRQENVPESQVQLAREEVNYEFLQVAIFNSSKTRRPYTIDVRAKTICLDM